ncbi:S-layer protein [Thermoclostridium stercorarium subsp. leptospartum DSM 9219]|uniref:S-layer protein n=1 Tax=Thermoclostridium stercorarium subsp. leptospartum DSM 9219 TaxID=1346611 RepID=A0A1B1YI38_THEST|nr:S-layer protein [Thermoclostridium stercorarium]ANX00437.1 S-layer protein [Thermoclostridium stercorarium subsp. leptospartum DSM 9219]
MKYLKRFTALTIVLAIFIGIISPLLEPSFAANEVFNPTITYNLSTGRWDISWTAIDGTDHYFLTYHEPDENSPNGVKLVEMDGSVTSGKNVVSLSLLPDHIYDFTFKFTYGNDTVRFRNKFNELVLQDTVFFLADITFEGTSFNDRGGILDNSYDTNSTGPDEPVTKIFSGHKPQITLRWKVPTIYYAGKGIVRITELQAGEYGILEPGSANTIDYCYFHIRMNEITDRVTPKNYRTALENGKIIVKETGDEVSGFGADGAVTDKDGFVSIVLDQSDGIEAGTEYANVDIRLFFWDKDKDQQVLSTRLLNGYGAGQGFSVVNRDIVFQNLTLDSIFTPMRFEVYKVDIDKIEVRIKKIKNKNYPNLYYQVQEAGAVSDFLEGQSSLSGGIKMPDASIPDSVGWGSIIIEVPLNENGEHPQYYYRVVVTDGDSKTPLGSLAIDLSKLDQDTGKPPVPREIEVQPIYQGKQKVNVNGTEVKIPLTKIRVSFEKPLFWDSMDENSSLSFHVLLSTYLSDNVKESETKKIGEPEVTVNLPVKEKRVAVITRDQIKEDESTGRLYFEIGGIETDQNGNVKRNRLFTDFGLDFENDKGYPDFLVPNTKYYLRMFTTWSKDDGAVRWVDGNMADLSEIISYISPVVSFTTYPTRDMPIPVPNFTLELDPKDEIDPETGKPVFNGIRVSFSKILGNEDWAKYTDVAEGRRIKYELYMADSNDPDSFALVDEIVSTYPDNNPNTVLSAMVTQYPDGTALKPNMTYYFKMRAILYVNVDDDFLMGEATPAKSITTPKTDSGSMDDLVRLPRTPVEFSIATNEQGELELTDSKVVLTWLHAEQDVTYEIVCTTKRLSPDATLEDYINDEYHVGDEKNPGFLVVYKNYKTNSNDTELNIDVLNTKLYELGFTYNENNDRWVRFPVNLPFLKPNRLYYFSIRAVRNRGTENAAYSKWVSIPVTTKMVSAPKFLEAVADVQLGFNIKLTGGIPAENLRVMLKKADQPEYSYVELPRSKYSVVRDGTTYYFRIYDLEPDTWYDILPFYKDGDDTYWYDSDDKKWGTDYSSPIQMKTRNTLNEIEIRFEGEPLYEYFIELRTDDYDDYVTLEYDKDEEDSDYGYTLKDGTRIEFYREKTAAYVEDKESDKYMYYAKIYQARQKKSDGTYVRKPLLSNTWYYIKVWARNVEDSNHVGPVKVRTDFSQKDYDDEHKQDEIKDIFESKADELTKKLYFTVDEGNKTYNRVLLKGAMISNLLKASGYSGVTVDISKEKTDVNKDIIIVPMEIIETLQRTNSRLTVKLFGGELALTADSINPDILNKNTGVTGVKETMLEITVERKSAGSVSPDPTYSYVSKVFDIGFNSLNMRRTYLEINSIIYDILKNPNASGPFKYGILDRELNRLLENKSTLTYKSYSDLEKVVELAIENVEAELSSYIKDILDGGRGFSASIIKRNELSELTGGVKLKILHSGSDNLVEPYVLPHGQKAWVEPSGIKGWLYPYLLVTAKTAGEYTVLSKPQIYVHETGGYVDPNLDRLSKKYDLVSVFGRTLYPGDFVTGENAVKLFEIVTETSGLVKGLSAAGKINYYGIGDIIPVSSVNRDINKGQADSLAVEIYAFKTGVPSKTMKPSSYMYIKNADKIPDAIYNRVVIALDLGITELESDYSYNADKKATVEDLLNAVVTVLKILGEW